MYCRYCGKEIKDGSRFCLYCGQAVQSISSGVQRTQEEQGAVPPPSPRCRPPSPGAASAGGCKAEKYDFEKMVVLGCCRNICRSGNCICG